MKTEAKDYWKHFKAASCCVSLEGTTKEAVFAELVENFEKARQLTADQREAALEALIAREALASTGVGQNVAIPHVKLVGLEEAIFSLSTHRRGLDWNSVDGAPVTLLFTVLRPERPSARYQPERHLDVMRWISTLGRDADFRRFAMAVTTKKELVELLREKSEA
jgi:mannitol/fructose-specific phosphotransferase system IIA component (Ntr-type)